MTRGSAATGAAVEPAVPSSLGKLEIGGRRATRLDFAKWLTNDDGGGPLTARVMANRFWYLMFGNGLARVLDDFGGQGEPPTHPELLDNLAIEFVQSGWDIKHMIKLIAMSRTYRQSSNVPPELLDRDPENRLVARQSRYRLPAEFVRDTSLSVSGLLNSRVGGPSVKPYQPAGLYKHLNYPKRKYEPDLDDRQWRRGVYVHRQRQYLHPMLKAFDAPSREECTAQRPRSNTPLAALTLLNDPTFVESARAFAASVLLDAGEAKNSRIDLLYCRAVSRFPKDFEREQLEEFVQRQLVYFRANPDAAEELLQVGIASRDAETDVAELAAWTLAARVMLNLSETLTRG